MRRPEREQPNRIVVKTLAETTFAVPRPRYPVEEYVRTIEAFGLDQESVYHRAGVCVEVREEGIRAALAEVAWQDEGRELEPLAGESAPAFASGLRRLHTKTRGR